ncbi:hypothetical protein ACWD7C_30895 [Streptomyces sp. NPDC005134]|uniref:hypothetical protein n=1 Tax=unclassified Streptomyces TaxID=2593676 RepID=UPI0033A6D813
MDIPARNPLTVALLTDFAMIPKSSFASATSAVGVIGGHGDTAPRAGAATVSTGVPVIDRGGGRW